MKNCIDKLLWGVTLFKLRYNRGNSWMNQVKDVMQTVISLYAAKSLLPNIDWWFIHINIASILTGERIILIGLGEIFIGYFIGWADEKKLLLWQRENIYASTKLNPIQNEMIENVSELCRRNNTNTTVGGEVMKIACCPDCTHNNGHLRLLYNQQTSILLCPKCKRNFDTQNTGDMETVKWV